MLQDEPESVAKAWTDEAVRRAGALERGEVEALDGEAAVAALEVQLPRIRPVACERNPVTATPSPAPS